MTQRIRQLLDEAVAAVEPAAPDAVATVLRRGRSARRRGIAGAAAAVLVLVGGGFAVRSLATTGGDQGRSNVLL